eukprot:gene11951-8226_t
MHAHPARHTDPPWRLSPQKFGGRACYLCRACRGALGTKAPGSKGRGLLPATPLGPPKELLGRPSESIQCTNRGGGGGATAKVEQQMRLGKVALAAVRRGAFTPLKHTLAPAYFFDGGGVQRLKQFLFAYKPSLWRSCRVTALHKEAADHGRRRYGPSEGSIPAILISKLRLPIGAGFGERFGERGMGAFCSALRQPPLGSRQSNPEGGNGAAAAGGAPAATAGGARSQAAIACGVGEGAGAGGVPRGGDGAAAPMPSIESLLMQRSRAVNSMRCVLGAATVESSAKKLLPPARRRQRWLLAARGRGDCRRRKRWGPFFVESLGGVARASGIIGSGEGTAREIPQIREKLPKLPVAPRQMRQTG